MRAAARFRVVKDTAPPAPEHAPRMRLLMSIPDAAAALDVGRDTIYQLIKRGKLRSVHFGARHVVVVASLHELIAEMLAQGE
jgi:excisionase family DNA binding protein